MLRIWRLIADRAARAPSPRRRSGVAAPAPASRRRPLHAPGDRAGPGAQRAGRAAERPAPGRADRDAADDRQSGAGGRAARRIRRAAPPRPRPAAAPPPPGRRPAAPTLAPDSLGVQVFNRGSAMASARPAANSLTSLQDGQRPAAALALDQVAGVRPDRAVAVDRCGLEAGRGAAPARCWSSSCSAAGCCFGCGGRSSTGRRIRRGRRRSRAGRRTEAVAAAAQAQPGASPRCGGCRSCSAACCSICCRSAPFCCVGDLLLGTELGTPDKTRLTVLEVLRGLRDRRGDPGGGRVPGLARPRRGCGCCMCRTGRRGS